jgi:hypothetical protein
MSELNKNSSILKYFVLSLFDISYESIKEEYVNAYINKEGTSVFIQLKDTLVPSHIDHNCYFSGVFEKEGITYAVLQLSEIYIKDLKLIVKGKYSQLSDLAKSKIVQLSGLDYKRYDPIKRVKFTSPIIAGLFKNPVYRQGLEERLGVILSDKAELIDKLTKEAFIESIIQ